MTLMFNSASVFNHDLSAWDVSSVTAMQFMFQAARRFNQDLSAWDVSSVTTMVQMFASNRFNQNLCAWASKSPQLRDVSIMFSGFCNNSSTPTLKGGTP
eukprot:scaffold6668_cov75-Attheya_sp.AAC.1